MNSTDVVVEINLQLDRICILMGNIDLRKLSPLHYTLAAHLLTATHFTTVLPVVKSSLDTHNHRHMDFHLSLQGRNMVIHPADHILLGKLRGPYHTARTIEENPLKIALHTYRLHTYRPDHLRLLEEAVEDIIIVTSGGVGMGVADDLAVAVAVAG